MIYFLLSSLPSPSCSWALTATFVPTSPLWWDLVLMLARPIPFWFFAVVNNPSTHRKDSYSLLPVLCQFQWYFLKNQCSALWEIIVRKKILASFCWIRTRVSTGNNFIKWLLYLWASWPLWGILIWPIQYDRLVCLSMTDQRWLNGH